MASKTRNGRVAPLVLALALVISCCCRLTRLEVLFSSAAPVLAPNIAVCHDGGSSVLDNTSSLQCCAPPPPEGFPARAFEFEEVRSLRVRRPAHKLSAAETEQLGKAYELMRALPQTDPRSFGHQANIHCAYCNEYYTQPNSTVPFQIHASWLFFSFHRWYLYFHERILARLLNDTSFALPFWNYDHPDGSTMPRSYVEYPPLHHQFREPSHLPPAVAAVCTITDRRREEQLLANRVAFQWLMITGATTQYKFFGQPYRAGDFQMPGYGTAEMMPHNSVHAWTGDSRAGLHDMGKFATSARDPLFYAHHSNIDRLWDVWKNISDSNTDIQDPDYLDSEFAFYDENAQLVTVTVRDSLSSAKLGYSFEEVENPWLTGVTVSNLSSGVAQLAETAVLCSMGEELVQPCSVQVARAEQKEAWEAKVVAGEVVLEETLLIQGIQMSRSMPAQMNVFVNLPDATASTPINCTEFAGTFSTLVPTSSARLGLGLDSIIRDLNLLAEASLVVTIVPIEVAVNATHDSSSGSGLSFSAISIEYQELLSE